MDKMLNCETVAGILGVSRGVAARIMSELPHADVSGRPDGTNRHLRVAESVLERYIMGELKRTPLAAGEAGNEAGKRADTGAPRITAAPKPATMRKAVSTGTAAVNPWGVSARAPYRKGADADKSAKRKLRGGGTPAEQGKK